jgi:hypothetical protein
MLRNFLNTEWDYLFKILEEYNCRTVFIHILILYLLLKGELRNLQRQSNTLYKRMLFKHNLRIRSEVKIYENNLMWYSDAIEAGNEVWKTKHQRIEIEALNLWTNICYPTINRTRSLYRVKADFHNEGDWIYIPTTPHLCCFS